MYIVVRTYKYIDNNAKSLIKYGRKKKLIVLRSFSAECHSKFLSFVDDVRNTYV